MSSKCLLHFERQYCSVLSVLLNILEFSIFSKGNFCLAIYPPLQQAHAGVCLFRHRMRWLGRQLKQGAPFYIGKLMMWFPQSWWWNYVRQEAAVGSLPSPVLNDLLPHSQWTRPRQRVSLCLQRASLRKNLSAAHSSPPIQSLLHYPFKRPRHLSHLALTLTL